MNDRVFHIRSAPPNAEYIGRIKHLGNDGFFGNPFSIGPTRSREVAIEQYRRWLWHKLKTDRGYRERVRALAGKPLKCHCKPKTCHGDVLTRAADWLSSSASHL